MLGLLGFFGLRSSCGVFRCGPCHGVCEGGSLCGVSHCRFLSGETSVQDPLGRNLVSSESYLPLPPLTHSNSVSCSFLTNSTLPVNFQSWALGDSSSTDITGTDWVREREGARVHKTGHRFSRGPTLRSTSCVSPESAHLSTQVTWVQAVTQVSLGSEHFVLYRAFLSRNMNT